MCWKVIMPRKFQQLSAKPQCPRKHPSLFPDARATLYSKAQLIFATLISLAHHKAPAGPVRPPFPVSQQQACYLEDMECNLENGVNSFRVGPGWACLITSGRKMAKISWARQGLGLCAIVADHGLRLGAAFLSGSCGTGAELVTLKGC